MSSNRLMYDSCAYQKAINESTGPFSYAMYTGKYENCAKCRIELGQFGGNGVSLFSGYPPIPKEPLFQPMSCELPRN